MAITDLIAIGIIFLAGSNKGYAQNLQVSDSVKPQSALTSRTDQVKINHQKSSDNFYKTDSIFSFHSPKGYVPSLLHNFGEQAIAPFHFKTKQWLIAGAAVGITAALIHFDNDIDDWARVQKQNHNWVDKTSPVITSLGSSTGIISVIGFGSLNAAFKNIKGVQTSLLATQALITSGIWVRVIKVLSGRERPSAAYTFSKSEGGQWHGPLVQFDQDLSQKKPGSSFDSFASGHTATAFSIATVFAMQYKDIRVVPIISYTAASLVGISRLTEHAHWASDVFAGALLGYLCGRQVIANFNKIHQNQYNPLQSKHKAELTLIQYGNQFGFSIIW